MDTRIPKAEFDAMLAEAAKEQAAKAATPPVIESNTPSLYDSIAGMFRTLLGNAARAIRGDLTQLDPSYPLFQVGMVLVLVGLVMLSARHDY